MNNPRRLRFAHNSNSTLLFACQCRNTDVHLTNEGRTRCPPQLFCFSRQLNMNEWIHMRFILYSWPLKMKTWMWLLVQWYIFSFRIRWNDTEIVTNHQSRTYDNENRVKKKKRSLSVSVGYQNDRRKDVSLISIAAAINWWVSQSAVDWKKQ